MPRWYTGSLYTPAVDLGMILLPLLTGLRLHPLDFELLPSTTTSTAIHLTLARMATNPAIECDAENTTCLSRLQSVGLAMVAEAGFISLLSLLILFGLIVRNVIRYRRYAHGKWSLIQVPADVFVLSLFVGDLLQAIGTFMDVRWVHRGVVQSGSFCSAQGAIQQLGETGVAMATIVIALHTFVAIWIRKGKRNLKVAYAVIFFTWVIVILFVAIAGGTVDNYYNPTPYWCWIGQEHMALRLAGEYIWLWIALCVSVVVYSTLFLWSRGIIANDEERWWIVKLNRKSQSDEKNKETNTRVRHEAASLALLAYPIAYSVIILPVSVARWAGFQGHSVPDGVTFFSVFLHDMFGCVNVMLLLTTKPDLLLFTDPRHIARGRSAKGGQGRAPGESASPSSERFDYDLNALKRDSAADLESQRRGAPPPSPSPSRSAGRSENSDDRLDTSSEQRV